MEYATRTQELAADNEAQNRERIRYNEERARAVQRVGEMQALVARLEREKETAVLASAEALIAGQPFDLSIFARLNDRLVQARRAAEILHARYVAKFERFGPVVSHARPGLRHTTL